MIPVRAIPCLLLRKRGLVKTVRFRKPVYLGDPINIVRIFNDKEVDELVILDIIATAEGKPPQFDYLEQLASECFIPLAYGGGVRTLEDIGRLFGLGVEKIVLNTRAVESPELIERAASRFGSQSVIVSIDVKKNLFGRDKVVVRGGRKRTGLEPAVFAREVASRGAGEILLNSVDRDGTMRGYDLDLIRRVSSVVNIPVVACGGAGGVSDLKQAVENGGASAAAAGSMFVFQGPRRGVLISYPSLEIREAFGI